MNKWITLMALAAPVVLNAQELNKPKIALRNWANGLNEPVVIANAGDNRLFVVQRQGTIKIVQDSMQVVAQPFLNIVDSVNSEAGEQGLLGLAFSPDYQESGWFYTYYIAGTDAGRSRVSRFHVSDNPDSADRASEQILYEWPQPYWNHNGGDLHFGPDGMLYVCFGDGGSGNDPEGNGQNYTEPLGGMIRIDVSDPDTTWTVPLDNPLINAGGDTLPEIWATGLRNPWRYSFDRLTGDLWIGDVGQNAWEEIDFWPANTNTCPNFGWRCREGFVATPGISQSGCGGASSYVSPVAAFSHDPQGWYAITGGYVYRGTQYPHLYGHYIFTDYSAGDFLTFGLGTNYDVDTLLLTTAAGYAAFGEGADGSLYVANVQNGQLKKIYDPCPMDAPVISTDGWELTSTEGSTYQWLLDGAAITGAQSQVFVPEQSGFYQVRVTYPGACSLISDTLTVIATGISSIDRNELKVYPVPATDNVMLERPRTGDDIWRVEVLDAVGRICASNTWAASESRLRLDIASLAGGLFTVRCASPDGAIMMTAPLVITR